MMEIRNKQLNKGDQIKELKKADIVIRSLLLVPLDAWMFAQRTLK